MIALYYIYFGIGIVGLMVIAWGAIVSLIGFISNESKRYSGVDICKNRTIIRHHLGGYILLGLEFLIASDIIKTVMNPSLQDLATLGAIVAIRTVLSFFLGLEMRDRHNCRES